VSEDYDYDDEAMVYDAASLLTDIIERMRREDPDNPIVKNSDACKEYAIRRYGSIDVATRGVACDEGGWIQ
jgi:hypothetical protein